MGTTTMADEYFQRYSAVQHEQLYRELMAGTPSQVNSLADVWHTTAETLRTAAAQLRTDLASLGTAWAGHSATAFQTRAARVAAWAEELANEATTMQTGLSAMSAALTYAQGHGVPVPSGNAAWDHDSVLGPLLGHTVTPADLAQSQERLARVVAELAVAYEMVDHRQWSTPWPAPSPELPGTALASDVALGAEPVPLMPLVGTQLAGAVGSAVPVAVPARVAVKPVAPPPVSVPTVSVLQGAATSLAGARDTGLSTDRTATSSRADEAATNSAPPPVMGGGLAPASGTGTGVIGRPMFDETSWSSDGGNESWRHGSDEAPPSVLGHPNRPG
jgi:uncharacterized protein YukE